MRFREFCGKTTSEMILAVRMQRVMSELQTSTKTVKQLAKDLHFRSTSHLCTLFKRHFGQTIGEFRKQGTPKRP